MKGFLTVHTITAEEAVAVSGAHVIIETNTGEVLFESDTDLNGNTPYFELDAPDVSLTLDKDYNKPAYSEYNVKVSAEGFRPVEVMNCSIVATVNSVLDVDLHPLLEGEHNPDLVPETIEITPVGLLLPVNQQQVTAPAPSVREVLIPDYITVHLGSPFDSSAKNVRVKFADYIANAASSEIYPTWPYNSLVANIHCITTFALNRVYTEWYRSRGFNFDITNSTAYDQYYVHGRNVYENLQSIAYDIFNVYARRFAFRNPFFTQFCSGTTVTCRGLSQWGTVDLANKGYSPLQILRYYFPNDLELQGTDNIGGIQQSFPGVALRLGSSGQAVLRMQNYLNRIRANYPLIPQIQNPSGNFDAQTETAVRTFQRTFSLSVDGVIGNATWNKISFIYIGIIRLAELDSEGERVTIGENPPNVVLRLGSRGIDVVELQFIINVISAYYDTVPSVIKDNLFDNETRNAVIEFQKAFALTPDGIVGPATWNKLYAVYKGIRDNAPLPAQPALPPDIPAFPGTFLRLGSQGMDVRTMQTFLNTIGKVYNSIPQIVADGIFGARTRNAVIAFQHEFLLVPDGIIGPITWDKIVEIFNLVSGRN